MTDRPLRLLGIFAHPDDESLGNAGTFVRYAAEGVETHVLTATRGQRGWLGAPDEYPGPEALGELREQELRRATATLGVRELTLLDYVDGEVAEANPLEIVTRIAGVIRRVRPQVVITFGPEGGYGHPDHIAMSQFATAAIVAAADASHQGPSGTPSHQVAKLYYMAFSADLLERYEEVFGELVMHVDGVERRSVGWPEWAITTWIDAEDYWRQAFDAVSCHRSQLPAYGKLVEASEDVHRSLWGRPSYYRAFSTVNGGRVKESDLFQGLRATDPSLSGT